MNLVAKLDQGIVTLVCAYSAIFFINGRMADQLIGVAALLAIVRCIKRRVSFEMPRGYARGMAVFFFTSFHQFSDCCREGLLFTDLRLEGG